MQPAIIFRGPTRATFLNTIPSIIDLLVRPRMPLYRCRVWALARYARIVTAHCRRVMLALPARIVCEPESEPEPEPVKLRIQIWILYKQGGSGP